MTEDRKDILLRAAYDVLRKASLRTYVESALYETVFYDDAPCEGSCLMNDIAAELNISDDTLPLPVPKDHWSRKDGSYDGY